LTAPRAGAPPRALARTARLILGVVYLVPLLWIVLTSFKSNAQILAAPNTLIFQPTLQTFRQVLSAGASSVLLSLQIVVATTVVVLAVAIPAAYALARRLSTRWTRIIALTLGGLLVLQMVPEPMTVIPLYGVLAQWHLLYQLPGLVLCDAALLAPFAVLLLRPFALAIPTALHEAAAIDGASRWQAFVRIVLPMLGNGIITVGAIVFIAAWGEFIYAINFLNEGSTFPVSGLLAQQISTYSVSWNRMMALAFLTSLPLVVLFLVVQKRLVRGLSVGAIK
jgi:ABC-type glycerol-3-phosphate transport system permease component